MLAGTRPAQVQQAVATSLPNPHLRPTPSRTMDPNQPTLSPDTQPITDLLLQVGVGNTAAMDRLSSGPIFLPISLRDGYGL